MKIKKGLQKEYDEYVKKNSNDGYSSCVVKAGEAVGKELDKGKSPEEAMDVDDKNVSELTGFMAGCLARAIVYFHPRGKEFKKWWNVSHGGAKDAKGVVNPAILTIKEKKG